MYVLYVLYDMNSVFQVGKTVIRHTWNEQQKKENTDMVKKKFNFYTQYIYMYVCMYVCMNDTNPKYKDYYLCLYLGLHACIV